MSDTDSFIDEVTEEVRRDRFYGYLRKYGWIAIAALVLIIGGAGVLEYFKAQEEAKAQALGDGMLAALAENDPTARAEALVGLSAETAEGTAVLQFLQAAALSEADDTEAAIAALQSVAASGDLPLIYRQIASFRSLLLQSETLDVADRRAGYETLAVPGVPFRLLAEEQLALIDIETGDSEAALTRLQSIVQDAEASAGLQQRAIQVIVALGGTLDPSGAPGVAAEE